MEIGNWGRCIVLLAVLALLAGAARAGPPLTVGRLDGQSLLGYAELQEDPAHLDDPARLPAQGWYVLGVPDLYRGPNTHSHWLRFSLHNPGPETRHWVVMHDVTWTDEMAMLVATAGGMRRQQVTATTPYAQRLVPSPRLAMAQAIEPGETQQVWLRVRNRQQSDLRLTVSLYEERSFLRATQSYAAVQGLFIGMLLFSAVIWSMFAVNLRQPMLVAYVMLLLSTALAWAALRGLIYQYLLPHAPGAPFVAIRIGMLWATCCAYVFVRLACHLDRVSPLLDRIALLIAVVYGGAALAAMGGLAPAAGIDYLARAGLLLMAVNALLSWLCWRRGIPNTGWLSLGWTCYGLALVGNRFSGVLPLPANLDLVPATAIQTSALLEVVCFTVSMVQWVRQQQRQRALAEQAANTDGLTGLLNRKGVDARLRRLLLEPAAPGQRWLAVVDIDFFKRVNDTYGHAAGDAVLRHFGEVLRATARAGDIHGRFGGEEFIIIYDGINLAMAQAAADRLRSEFAAQATLFDGRSIAHTLSIGLASWQPGDSTLQPWFERADAALYCAKQGGRNQVCVAQPASELLPAVPA